VLNDLYMKATRVVVPTMFKDSER